MRAPLLLLSREGLSRRRHDPSPLPEPAFGRSGTRLRRQASRTPGLTLAIAPDLAPPSYGKRSRELAGADDRFAANPSVSSFEADGGQSATVRSAPKPRRRRSGERGCLGQTEPPHQRRPARPGTTTIPPEQH